MAASVPTHIPDWLTVAFVSICCAIIILIIRAASKHDEQARTRRLAWIKNHERRIRGLETKLKQLGFPDESFEEEPWEP